MPPTRTLALLPLCLLASGCAAPTAPIAAPPPAAFRADGPVFRGESAAYAVEADAAGFAVTPRRTGSSVRFTPRGISRGGRVLAGAGHAGARVGGDGVLAVERAAGVREELRNGAQGVEQSWVFARKPAGNGELAVRVGVSGARFAGAAREGLRFAPEGAAAVRYGHGTWVDARGERTEVRARWEGGAVVLRVPEGVVERSVYPAVLDPTVGPEFAVDQPVALPALEGIGARVSRGASGWLVVFADARGTMESDVWGVRVADDGTLRDPEGFPIVSAPGQQVLPNVAFDGSNWLVVWRDGANVNATRVSAGGVVLDPAGLAVTTTATPYSASASPAEKQPPGVAFDGTRYLVAWQGGATSASTSDIRAARVGTDGTVLDATGITVGTGGWPSLAFDGAHWLLAWGAGQYVTDHWDYWISGARVADDGAVLDPDGTVLTTTSFDAPATPTVSSDGATSLIVWPDAAPGQTFDVYALRVDHDGLAISPGRFVVSNAAHDQIFPAATFDGTDWLVTWLDARTDASDLDLHAARVSPDGTVLDPDGFTVYPPSLGLYGNWPALASDGAHTLVVWSDARDGSTQIGDITSGSVYQGLYGARLDPGANASLSPGSFPLSRRANVQSEPAAAFNGTDWLVVWQDQRNATPDLYAVRVAADGTVRDPTGFAVSTAPGAQSAPAIASDGTNWLVAWTDTRDGTTDQPLYATRVAADATVLDPAGFPVGPATGRSHDPAVGFDGTQYLVAWVGSASSSTLSGLYAARVTTAGTVLDAGNGITLLAPSISALDAPAMACARTHCLVTWSDDHAGSRDVYATRVDPNGAVLDPTPITVYAGPARQNEPAAASDGTDWLIAWTDARAGGAAGHIYAGRVNAAGSALDPAGVLLSASTSAQRSATVHFDGASYLTGWVDVPNAPQPPGLYGTRVSPALDAVIDQPSLLLASPRAGQDAPTLRHGTGGAFLLAYQHDEPTAGGPRVFARVVRVEQANGAACGAASECESGFCVDGVCCDTACDDGDPCTLDRCAVGGGCVHDVDPACRDAGAVGDAGVGGDAGDAGGDVGDAGVWSDAGDAGSEAGAGDADVGDASAGVDASDAGAMRDAGTTSDASVVGDAGAMSDASVVGDARDAAEDARDADGGDGRATVFGGCGCSAAGHTPAGGAVSASVALVALALALARAGAGAARRRRGGARGHRPSP